MGYYSKLDLYKIVDTIRENYKIDNDIYPINSVELCKNKDEILIDEIPFKTAGMRGMAIVSDEEKDIILLNSYRDCIAHNFDCSHELIHLNLHRNQSEKTFNCYDKVKPHQDEILEWQANEGAAELLVPYKLFLPKIKDSCSCLKDWQNIRMLKFILASDFCVTETVIQYRIESLKYEICQFLNGTSIDDLDILSHKQEVQQGINLCSINDYANYDYESKVDRKAENVKIYTRKPNINVYKTKFDDC